MIKAKQRKLFRLPYATDRRSFCLVLLISAFTFCHAGTIDKNFDSGTGDSLTVYSCESGGEIFISKGTLIVDTEKKPKLISATTFQTKKEKFQAQKKPKSDRTETPVRKHPDIVRKTDKKLVPSRSSGVSFSNSKQNSFAIAQVDFGKIILLKTEKTVYNLGINYFKKDTQRSFSSKIKDHSHLKTFYVRPPPLSYANLSLQKR